ncbi:uncharacterized protein ASPGLDRAFT_49335 [Aspergillus glaucus CBS 516.65]|uniref:Uncharacterized protein n=1 Tax=Aspergillus glaucus CBS 516.65 TaxID=1160497 RepID=A0A1L9VF59_ASPGL|nr:hypothetical protein ASPGLDRAFT_49335 [Aspergillus glaucus CBS 516.65]OJJ82529.1 hypothetical protein ASPGLDRAFT_49335 [Aspergillus glaucus CBS 516.65]
MRPQFLSLVLLASLSTSTIAHEESIQNANHIFNAIHSSMRQWGSSLYHNGMSFFLASVPTGTQLYHGGMSPDHVIGTEWLAFEPEHAMLFARMPPMGSQPGVPGRGPHKGPPPGHGGPRGPGGQKPLSLEPPEDEEPKKSGWLQTYVPVRDLRLLYIDGMSAGKTSNGTLDSQNRILVNDSVHDDRIMNEFARAKEFCRLSHEVWDDRLDGVIRMEAGFEIILCEFERDLHLLREVEIQANKGGIPRHLPRPGKDHNKTMHDIIPDSGPWMKAITARYHGIGGNRVRVNYNHFVTAFTYELDIFGGESKELRPRLSHLDTSQLEPIRQDLKALIMGHDTDEPSFDWQSVTDMVVEKYAHTLKSLVSPSITANTKQLHDDLKKVADPFFDFGGRNITAEAERCATQFIPFNAPTQSVAARAVRSIADSVCFTLLEAFDEPDYDTAVTKIQDLVDYLAWTTWKECRGCGDNEVCMIPIWPMGILEDWENPTCRDIRNPQDDGVKYWGWDFIPGPTKHADS